MQLTMFFTRFLTILTLLFVENNDKNHDKKNNSYFLLASWIDHNVTEMYYVRHTSALIIKSEYAKCKMRRYFLVSTKMYIFLQQCFEIVRWVLQESVVETRRFAKLSLAFLFPQCAELSITIAESDETS